MENTVDNNKDMTAFEKYVTLKTGTGIVRPMVNGGYEAVIGGKKTHFYPVFSDNPSESMCSFAGKLSDPKAVFVLCSHREGSEEYDFAELDSYEILDYISPDTQVTFSFPEIQPDRYIKRNLTEAFFSNLNKSIELKCYEIDGEGKTGSWGDFYIEAISAFVRKNRELTDTHLLDQWPACGTVLTSNNSAAGKPAKFVEIVPGIYAEALSHFKAIAVRLKYVYNFTLQNNGTIPDITITYRNKNIRAPERKSSDDSTVYIKGLFKNDFREWLIKIHGVSRVNTVNYLRGLKKITGLSSAEYSLYTNEEMFGIVDTYEINKHDDSRVKLAVQTIKKYREWYNEKEKSI